MASMSPSSIEEIFELMIKYLELFHECFTILPRILGDHLKHHFCGNQIFRASISMKFVLYCMLDLLLNCISRITAKRLVKTKYIKVQLKSTTITLRSWGISLLWAISRIRVRGTDAVKSDLNEGKHGWILRMTRISCIRSNLQDYAICKQATV